MKKKGFVGDIFVFALILFAMAIVVISMYYVLDTVNTAWQSNSAIPTESKTIMSTQQSRFVGVWDNFFIIAIIGYAIALVILSFAIRSHPVFAGLGIIIMIVFGIVAVHLSNAFDNFGSSSGISAAADQFSITSFIMNSLPYFVIGFGVIFLIILFAKTQQETGL